MLISLNYTRWNSQNDCIDTFLKNYLMVLEISIEHESELDKNIVAFIKNPAVHMEAMHLQKQLQILLNALNAMQRDDCTLGEVVHVWIQLLQAPVLEPYNQIIKKRFNQCITTLHLVAYQAHPLYKGVNLTAEQEEKAAKWIRGINLEYEAPLLAFAIEDEEVYPKSILDKSVVKSLTPTKWWKIVRKQK